MNKENKENRINILYVDDEINNCKSFKSSFRREYNVFISTSPKEGREILQKEDIDIVFSDQRMPEETGVEFLEFIYKEYPNMVRVLVTGYTDYSTIVEGVNKANIFKVVQKPFDLDVIHDIINSQSKKIFVNKSNILLNQLEDKNIELERTEGLYRILAQNIPGFVVLIFDREYNYLLVDGTALDTQDFPSEEIEGKNMREVLDKDKADMIISAYDKSYETGIPISMDFERKEKYYHSSFIPIKNETGEYDRGLVVVFETTEMKKIEKELESKIIELERANEYLDNFVYSVAHDLKSPVSNLLSLMNLLETRKVDKGELIDNMSKGISRLDKTLDSLVEIIDVQKNVNRQPEVVDLNDIKELVEYNISHHINTIDPIINYDFKVSKVLFVEVYLISIFQNIISNSLKYSSEERRCIIDVTAELIEDNIVLTFKDNGIGIDDIDQDKIFEPFNRLSTQANGKGIGLHIVKSIIEKSQGSIEVESVVGVGTEIKIFFSKKD